MIGKKALIKYVLLSVIILVCTELTAALRVTESPKAPSSVSSVSGLIAELERLGIAAPSRSVKEEAKRPADIVSDTSTDGVRVFKKKLARSKNSSYELVQKYGDQIFKNKSSVIKNKLVADAIISLLEYRHESLENACAFTPNHIAEYLRDNRIDLSGCFHQSIEIALQFLAPDLEDILDLIRVLVLAGADINERNGNGDTPLMSAYTCLVRAELTPLLLHEPGDNARILHHEKISKALIIEFNKHGAKISPAMIDRLVKMGLLEEHCDNPEKVYKAYLLKTIEL